MNPLLRAARGPRVWLTVYFVLLATVALWPVPVDGGVGPIVALITRIIPVLTYTRIEFAANILLFVPLGFLLWRMLRQRSLVLPIAIVATVAIESVQAVFLDERVSSMRDLIANVTGACVGMLVAAFVEARARRRREPRPPLESGAEFLDWLVRTSTPDRAASEDRDAPRIHP